MSNKSFKEAHPDICQIIEERDYCTSRYERRELGVLKEVWQKDEAGEWQNISRQVIHDVETAKQLEAAQKELKRLEAYLAKHNIDTKGGNK